MSDSVKVETVVSAVNEALPGSYEAAYHEGLNRVEVQRGKSKLARREWQELLLISAKTNLPLIEQLRQKMAEEEPDVHRFKVVVAEGVPGRIRDAIEESVKETVFAKAH